MKITIKQLRNIIKEELNCEAYSVRWQKPKLLGSQTVSGFERFSDQQSAVEYASQLLSQKGKEVGSLTITKDGTLDSQVIWKRNQRSPGSPPGGGEIGTILALDDDWNHR